MLNFVRKHLQLFGIIDKESNTFVGTPEPSEACELESMYLLADWLHWAYLNNLVTQERYIDLSTYLNTIPSVGDHKCFIINTIYSIICK